MVNQAEIHRKSISYRVKKRKEAVNQIEIHFAELLDKEQAWADLLRLTHDKDSSVREEAVESMGSAFPHVPDKEQAWADLIQLAHDEDSSVREEAVESMGSAFPYAPDKEQAWADLLQLAHDEDSSVREEAVESMGSAFPHVPDKEQAWADLLQLAHDADDLYNAAKSLGSAFSHVPDKKQAWADLIRLAGENRDIAGSIAAVWLEISAFPRVSFIRLLRLLGSAFPYVLDKKQAWADLLRLVHDKDISVQVDAAMSLGLAFPNVPDKKQAWADLLRLAHGKDCLAQANVIRSMGLAFPNVPDKKQAWADLLRLAHDKDISVQVDAVESLGSAFSHVPDKEQAWADLNLLTQDEDSKVWEVANFYLGRASIFRATEAESEEVFRKELENALVFFERASQSWVKPSLSSSPSPLNPYSFCLLFYRSFYALRFKKLGAKDEIRIYLAAAKRATKGSENKEQLLEVIENLANAIKEAHDVRKVGFGILKRDLNAYRRYCDQAVDLLDTTEGKAPGATKLIKRELPIINQRIKELLAGIDKETKILCDATHDTEAEDYVNPTCQGVRKIMGSMTRNPIELDIGINRLIPNLSFMVENLPEQVRDFCYDKIEILNKEEYLEDKLSLINEIIVFVISHINMSKDLKRLENKLDDIMISLEPGVRQELSVTVGAKAFGTGIEHKITIPLQEIKYSDLEKDLESIKGKTIMKLATLPPKLAEKVKGYLIRNKKDDILKHLS